MIYHFKDNLQGLSYILKTPLLYSDTYTFIPIKLKGSDEFIVQTPKLFVPFGIQENLNSKKSIMISFQNKENDIYTKKFYNDLQYIYTLINIHFKDKYNVNPFIKKYKTDQIMNIKLDKHYHIYDSRKHECDDIPIYSYASLIIHLSGLWISNDQLWFQWIAHQIKSEISISLSSYAFRDISIPAAPPLPPSQVPPSQGPPPPIDKYKKMITMGIPSAAVNQKKLLDAKSNIKASDLLSVRLKKSTKKIHKPDMNGFEPPTLDTLQLALQRLRSIIKET